MSAFDFTGLTPAQQALLTYDGWHVGSKLIRQPQPRTVRRLLERGLVVPRDTVFLGVRITEYDVPAAVHAAWCSRKENKA